MLQQWIKDYKDLPVADYDLVDNIREKISEKIYTRQEIANRMEEQRAAL